MPRRLIVEWAPGQVRILAAPATITPAEALAAAALLETAARQAAIKP